MQRDVLIDITSSSIALNGWAAGQKPETLQLLTRGKLYQCGDKIYLQYAESPVTGLDGTVTTLRLQAGRVVLIRTGRYSWRQEFQSGQSSTTRLRTPEGELALTVAPTLVQVDMGENGGRMTLEYLLSFGGQDAATRHRLEVKVAPLQPHGSATFSTSSTGKISIRPPAGN